MMAVGLNVVVGYSGLLDLGYVAFYAAGAYSAGRRLGPVRARSASTSARPASLDHNVDHLALVVLLIAGCFTAITGILIGLPTLRLRGDYLAIVTLGFGEIVPQVVRNATTSGSTSNGTFWSPIDQPRASVTR